MEHWTIIGSGNVAKHLIKLLALHRIPLQVSSRNKAALSTEIETYNLNFVSLGDIKDSLCLIAVSDDAIEEVVSQLDPSNYWAHTSGAANAIKSDKAGVFYPLQTFRPEIDVNWDIVPIYVEAENEEWCEKLYDLACQFSEKVAILEGEQRLKLHLAAVFACNFPMYLQSIAEDFMKEAQLDFESLFPLMDQTLDNVKSQNVFTKLTGPAIRNDVKTIDKHVKLLEEKRHPDFLTIYNTLTQIIKKHKNEL